MKHKKTLRRGLGILLSVLLCLTLVPATALAEGTETQTADFATDADAALALLNAAKTEGAVDSTWDSTNKKLTLNGVNFTTSAATAVKLPDGAKIVVSENTTNTITSTNQSMDETKSYGIYVNGKLTIEGSGTLTVTGGTAKEESYGVRADNGSVAIENSKVTATGSAVENSGVNCFVFSMGISGASVAISGKTAEVTAIGGTATSDYSRSYGIHTGGNVTISGGKVTATGDMAKGKDSMSSGIFAVGNVNISSGTVEATGGTAGTAETNTSRSRGIYGKSVTIYGETTDVIATGNTTTGENSTSYGIFVTSNNSDSISVSGGHVIAQTQAGADTVTRMALNMNPNLSAYTGYQWRSSSDGEYKSSAYTYDAGHTYVEFSSGSNVTTYTVRFDANGGTGTMTAATGISGSFTLPACGFTAPEGKQFKGWSYSTRDKVITKDTINITEDTTLYAIWAVPVTNIAATVTAPALGATPDDNPGYTATPKDSVYLKSILWCKIDAADFTGTKEDEWYEMESNEKFEEGYYYAVDMKFNTNTGYKMTEGMTGTVNGKPHDNTYFNNIFDGKSKYAFLDAVFGPLSDGKYTITVTEGKATVAGSEVTKAAKDTTVSLTANAAPSGKVFDKWEVVSGDIALENANNTTTTFKMPANAVSVKATYKEIPATGGGSIVIIQRPVIEGDAGAAWTLSSDGTKVTISAKEGFTLADVTLNGTSKGEATELTGLKTGDKVVIRTVSDAEVLAERLAAVQLVARSKTSSANGKAAIKVYWYAEDGSDIRLDGYEIFRSTKRYSGYGKTPFFETDRETYWNTAIKSGNTYYYKVRGYIELNGERYYTEWSKKAIRTVK